MVIRQDTNGLGYPHRAFPLTKRQFVMRPGGGGRVDVLAIRGWGGGGECYHPIQACVSGSGRSRMIFTSPDL